MYGAEFNRLCGKIILLSVVYSNRGRRKEKKKSENRVSTWVPPFRESFRRHFLKLSVENRHGEEAPHKEDTDKDSRALAMDKRCPSWSNHGPRQRFNCHLDDMYEDPNMYKHLPYANTTCIIISVIRRPNRVAFFKSHKCTQQKGFAPNLLECIKN